MKAYLVGAAVALAVAGGARAEPPPASAFGRLPAIQQAAISPNGQNIAMLGGPPDDRSVIFALVDRPQLRILKLGDVETIGLRWAGDGYVLAQVAYWKQFDPTHAYHMYRSIAITPEAKATSKLLDGDQASRLLTWHPVVGVVDGPSPRVMVEGLVDSTGPDHSMNTRIKQKGEDTDFQLALWKVDPATGRGVVTEKGDFDTQGWDVDLSGEARVRISVDELTHKFGLLGRAKGAKRWTTLVDRANEEERESYLGYSDLDDAIYQTTETDGALQVVRRKLADGVAVPIGHPVRGSGLYLLWDAHRNGVVGIGSGAEQDKIEWLDPEIGGVYAALSRAFKTKSISLSGWSTDRTRFIVHASSPASPGEWYLFDRTKKELSPLGDDYPELKGASFGPTQWITYKARDGLEIPAYLTLPPTTTPGRKPPLIVLPHGGPAARDDDDFDYLTQFLATRGYAVLRPQYRGSAGFGRAFELAGRGEWGGKVQTDLLDGISAVAARGLADTSRTCIVGWSFGGYSALAGVALHPEAYRCAASMAGLSDLGLLLTEKLVTTGHESGTMRDLHRQLGEGGADKLNATSPLKQVASIRAPVLLMHGDQDTTAPYAQSTVMAAALKAAGKPFEFVTFEGQDHYLLKSAPRTKMLETLGTFLAKNLPVNP